MVQRVKLFIFSSTAQEDIVVAEKLDNFLFGMKNSGKIEVRSIKDISAGSDKEKGIRAELLNADLILLIITIDFAKNSKTWQNEIGITMQRHERQEVCVIPIKARSTPPLDILLTGKLEELPGNNKTIADFPDADKVYTSIVKEIEDVVDKILERKEKKAQIFSNEEQSRKPKIFLSVGSTEITSQINYIDLLKKKFLSRGFQLATVENWDNEDPIKPIYSLMKECVGCIVLLLERYYIEEGKLKRGSGSEKPLKGLALSTPWNHIEATLAYSENLPLLILKDKNVYNDGVFKDEIENFMPVEIEIDNFNEWELKDKKKIFLDFIKNIKSFSRK